jgi:hypothetical protein
MRWLDDIVIPLVLLIGICCFVSLCRFRTRGMTRRSSRTAESMYAQYADSPQKQRKYAQRRGGEWRDQERGSDPLAPRAARTPRDEY